MAGATSDYDVTLAMDQLLDYVLSDQGAEFRRIFAAELVNAVDQLGADTTTYVLRNWRALAQSTPLAPVVPPPVGGLEHDPGADRDDGLVRPRASYCQAPDSSFITHAQRRS